LKYGKLLMKNLFCFLLAAFLSGRTKFLLSVVALNDKPRRTEGYLGKASLENIS